MITGASAGVGRAVTREFARQGARLGLLARGRAGLEAARADAELLGASQVATVAADVADAAQVEAAAAMLEAELGPPDVWVNNAMTSAFAPAWEITAEEYRRMAEVIYLGYVHGTLAALARMRPRDRGTIVQVGSALAYRGIRCRPLLRRQARHPGLRRLAPRRPAPRRQPRPGEHGASAGSQHHPVHLGADPAASPPPAGPAHLPARGGGQGDRLGGPAWPRELHVGARRR